MIEVMMTALNRFLRLDAKETRHMINAGVARHKRAHMSSAAEGIKGS